MDCKMSWKVKLSYLSVCLPLFVSASTALGQPQLLALFYNLINTCVD